MQISDLCTLSTFFNFLEKIKGEGMIRDVRVWGQTLSLRKEELMVASVHCWRELCLPNPMRGPPSHFQSRLGRRQDRCHGAHPTDERAMHPLLARQHLGKYTPRCVPTYLDFQPLPFQVIANAQGRTKSKSLPKWLISFTH